MLSVQENEVEDFAQAHPNIIQINMQVTVSSSLNM